MDEKYFISRVTTDTIDEVTGKVKKIKELQKRNNTILEMHNCDYY